MGPGPGWALLSAVLDTPVTQDVQGGYLGGSRVMREEVGPSSEYSRCASVHPSKRTRVARLDASLGSGPEKPVSGSGSSLTAPSWAVSLS